MEQVGGGVVGAGWITIQRIMPLCGSILQVGTCQILSLAENPRWSRVWQNLSIGLYRGELGSEAAVDDPLSANLRH